MHFFSFLCSYMRRMTLNTQVHMHHLDSLLPALKGSLKSQSSPPSPEDAPPLC